MGKRKLVTVSELAELLSLKERHIYNLTERRVIPCIKAGALLRFDPDAVEEALARPARKDAGR